MTEEAFEHSNWQAVIDSHRLESHAAAEWLRWRLCRPSEWGLVPERWLLPRGRWCWPTCARHREEHHVGSAIRRDSARSRKWVAPAERVGAAEATILLSQRAPHELQPCQRSGLSSCALPAKLPGRRGR